MKNILFVTTVSNTLKWFVNENAENLSRNGFNVFLVSNGIDDNFIKSCDFAKCINCPGLKRGFNFLGTLKSIFFIKKVIKENNINLIEYQSPNASFCASIAAKICRVKIRIYRQCGIRYVGEENFIKRFIEKKIEKITCKCSTVVKAVSEKNKQFAIKEKLCKRNKISVTGNGGTIGVDLEKCNDIILLNKKELRKNLKLNDELYYFIFVGRLNKDKGINELIQAFLDIYTIRNDVGLILIGPYDNENGPDLNLLDSIKKNPNVICTGLLNEEMVFKYMRCADCLVHPTFREGFGKVLQEAMAFSLPIITTNIPGPSEVIEDRISGILVEPRSTIELFDGMMRVLQNQENSVKYGFNGRIRVEKLFDRKIMLNNLLNEYLQMVNTND